MGLELGLEPGLELGLEPGLELGLELEPGRRDVVHAAAALGPPP